jgi:hypothetical protein
MPTILVPETEAKLEYLVPIPEGDWLPKFTEAKNEAWEALGGGIDAYVEKTLREFLAEAHDITRHEADVILGARFRQSVTEKIYQPFNLGLAIICVNEPRDIRIVNGQGGHYVNSELFQNTVRDLYIDTSRLSRKQARDRAIQARVWANTVVKSILEQVRRSLAH